MTIVLVTDGGIVRGQASHSPEGASGQGQRGGEGTDARDEGRNCREKVCCHIFV